VSGSFVSPGMRARVRGLAEPVARALGRLGLTPNHLTFIGFGIALVAAAAAAWQSWLIAGLLVLFGGVFDLFDGTLARATGRVSKLGAFYDSVFDRWGESVTYLGIAIGCVGGGYAAGAALAAAAMASAFMVGYTRAKSELLGFTPGTGMAGVGLAPREIRLVILSVGLLATGMAGGVTVRPDGDLFVLVDGVSDGGRFIGLTLAVIAVLATITTIQRILHVRAQAREG